MTQPTPTPEEQPANLDKNESTQSPKGFFKRVREVLSKEPETPIHPSEAAEIVVDMDENTTHKKRV